MKLLRIDESGDLAGPLLLHPQLSVISGVRGASRARLIAGLAGLAAGRVEGIAGELEAHGVRFDLSPEALGILDAPHPVDIVLRATDLPGSTGDGGRLHVRQEEIEVERDGLVARLAEARDRLAEAETARQHAADQLDAARASRSGEHDEAAALAAARLAAEDRVEQANAQLETTDATLAAARAEHADRQAALEQAAAEASTSLAERRASVHEASSAAAAAVDAAQAELDPGAVAELEAARDAVAQAETALAEFLAANPEAAEEDDDEPEPEPEGEPEPEPEPDVPTIDPARVAVLRERQTELHSALLPLAAVDATPVAAALAELVDPAGEAATRADRARELAEAWQDVTAQLDALGVPRPGVLPSGLLPGAGTNDEDEGATELDAARFRLTQARRQLAEAQTQAVAPPLDVDQIAELEAAHTAVLESQERSEGRFGGGKAKRRLEEARVAEQEVLTRLGFETYAEFMMSATRSVSVADEAIVEVAARHVAEAEAAFDELMASLDAAGSDGDATDDDVADDDPTSGATRDSIDAADRDELLQRRSDLIAEIEALARVDAPADPLPLLQRLQSGWDDDADPTALRRALSDVGMALDDAEFHLDTLVALARVWLAEQESATERRVELEALLAEVEAELGDAPPDPIDAGADTAPDEDGDDEAAAAERAATAAADARAAAAALRQAGIDERTAAVEAAQGRLDAAQARLAAHEAAEQALADREEEFMEAQAAEDDLASAVEAELADGPDGSLAAELEAAEAALQSAQAAHALAVADTAEAVGALAELAGIEAPSPGDDPLPPLVAVLEQTTGAVASASAQVRTLDVEVASIERRLAEAQLAVQASQDGDAGTAVSEDLLEEIEWYLLSRMAAQRQVSVAGSLPLVLDDPFRAFAPDEAIRLLGSLERMAGAIQLVVFTDDRAIVAWAEELGDRRASVLQVS